MAPPDPARGRRHLRAVAAGGSLLLSATVVGYPRLGGRRDYDSWGVAQDALTCAAVFLALCALMYRGVRWPRPLVVGLCWFIVASFAMLFMMAGGPLLFTAGAVARADGEALVAALCGYATLARLVGSPHVRAFIDAQRARRDARRAEAGT